MWPSCSAEYTTLSDPHRFFSFKYSLWISMRTFLWHHGFRVQCLVGHFNMRLGRTRSQVIMELKPCLMCGFGLSGMFFGWHVAILWPTCGPDMANGSEPLKCHPSTGNVWNDESFRCEPDLGHSNFASQYCFREKVLHFHTDLSDHSHFPGFR